MTVAPMIGMRLALLGVLLAALVGALSGCFAPTAPAPADSSFATRATAEGVDAMNASAFAVHYAIMDRQVVPLALLATCVGGPHCPTVPARSSSLIPWPRYPMDQGGPEYTLFWWFAVPDDAGGLRPDSIRQRILVR